MKREYRVDLLPWQNPPILDHKKTNIFATNFVNGNEKAISLKMQYGNMYMNDMIYIFWRDLNLRFCEEKKSVQPEEYHKALTFLSVSLMKSWNSALGRSRVTWLHHFDICNTPGGSLSCHFVTRSHDHWRRWRISVSLATQQKIAVKFFTANISYNLHCYIR